jgi:hypothetical protein
MNKVYLLILSLLLCGCAEYSVSPSIDGLRSPSDLVPQPFPDAKPNSQN